MTNWGTWSIVVLSSIATESLDRDHLHFTLNWLPNTGVEQVTHSTTDLTTIGTSSFVIYLQKLSNFWLKITYRSTEQTTSLPHRARARRRYYVTWSLKNVSHDAKWRQKIVNSSTTRLNVLLLEMEELERLACWSVMPPINSPENMSPLSLTITQVSHTFWFKWQYHW